MNPTLYKTFEKIIYLKLCWNRAWSHINIPVTIIEKILLVAVFLKVFNINNYVIIGIIASLGIVSLFIIGFLDLKNGIAEMETSLSNKYNPEIQSLLKK